MRKKKKRKADDFTRGYLCALSIIFHSHGGCVTIDEPLRAIDATSIDPSSIDEFDRPMLIKFQEEGCT